MKVLHVVSNLSIRSGIMSVLMNYYRNIDTSEIQFGFMYFDERAETFEDEIKELGGKIFKVVRVTKFISFYKDLKEFCKREYGEYQILHIHDLFMTPFLKGMKRKAGIKSIIIHSHATKFSDHRLGEIRNRVLSIANMCIPDYYFACSKKAGRVAFGKKFDRVGCVMNNAIDIDRFHPDKDMGVVVRQELGLEGRYVVGHVGNFVFPKNHTFLIRVFESVLKRNKAAVLLLVGEGDLKEQILDECKRKEIDKNVLFLGTRTDVNRVMSCFDKFLFPSLYEGLGIVLVEAQASGVPCVFSDVIPKEANVLQECNRTLSLNDSIENWADAVLQKVEIDTSCVARRVEAAGYNIKKEALEIKKIYDDILKKCKKEG